MPPRKINADVDDAVMNEIKSGPDTTPSWTLGRMAFQLDDNVEKYVLEHSMSYGAAGAALVDETVALGNPAVMMLAKEEYAVLRFLARAMGSQRALDVGTFTGLSALAFAQGMPPNAKVTTIDRNPEWAEIARRHWQMAGVAAQMDLRIGEAADVLADLAKSEERSFDIAFIDVEKARIQHYFDAVLDLLVPRGLVIVDNTLWHGWVLDKSRTDPDTEGLRKFNEGVARDRRLEVVMLTIGDGLSLIRRSS